MFFQLPEAGMGISFTFLPERSSATQEKSHGTFQNASEKFHGLGTSGTARYSAG
jgi:hypothetical protein